MPLVTELRIDLPEKVYNEVFKKFDELGFDIHTCSRCTGYGNHCYYKPTLDGRLYEFTTRW